MDNIVEELMTEMLPGLFADPDAIGRYGDLASSATSLGMYAELMESAPVSSLGSQLALIVNKLADADPQKIAKKPTWWQKVTGATVETNVRYQVARAELETLLEATEHVCDTVRSAVAHLDSLMKTQISEVAHLDAHLRAGREYLARHPNAGVPSGEMSFDNPRERFARKLANLAALLASHEMSIAQLRLTRAQALDMLERFGEVKNVLIPVWRQHTLALISAKNMTPELLVQAKKAHEALMLSLSKSKY